MSEPRAKRRPVNGPQRRHFAEDSRTLPSDRNHVRESLDPSEPREVVVGGPRRTQGGSESKDTEKYHLFNDRGKFRARPTGSEAVRETAPRRREAKRGGRRRRGDGACRA